jgi:hypothetical protein
MFSRSISHHRRSTRSVSHYLSDKWLKEPFDIGYPIDSNAVKFPQVPFNNSSEDFTPIYPRPVDCRGLDLFGIQSQISTKSYLKKKWNNLDETTRERFFTGPNIDHLYQERLRVWRGYETVEYRKRYHSSWNPYPSLGLYPWEIIKDKLRNRTELFGFECDYYDVLIKEAFGRNRQRKAVHIFYTDVSHQFPSKKFTWSGIQKEYAGLENSQYYEEKETRRKEQALMTRTKYSCLGFHDFYEEIIRSDKATSDKARSDESKSANFSKNSRLFLQACKKWEGLLNKKKYQRLDLSYTNSSTYREKLLDIKTTIVMDYLYYTGGVVGAGNDYDWLRDKQQKCGAFKYLNKVYTDEIY